MLNQSFSPLLDDDLVIQSPAVTDAASDLAAISGEDPRVITLSGTTNLTGNNPNALLVVKLTITAAEIADNNESYEFQVVGSNDDFTTKCLIASKKLGALETLGDGNVDITTGIFWIPFFNRGQTAAAGAMTQFAKLRFGMLIGGTVATGVTWAAELVPNFFPERY